MKKRIIALVLAVAIIVALLPLTVSAGVSAIVIFPDDIIIDDPKILMCPSKFYHDAPSIGSWAHNGIDFCLEIGLMNGVGDGYFNPNGLVTRAQLVTILYRYEGEPEVEFKGTFTDVPAGKWYSDPIEWAAANGIVNGTSPGKFNPMGNITREQIAAILYRYSGSPELDGKDSRYANKKLSMLPDRNMVHSYANDAITWAYLCAYINGVQKGEETYLAPQDYATRAQIATIIMRYTGETYTCPLCDNEPT